MSATPINHGAAFRAGVILVPLLQLVGGGLARYSGAIGNNAWYQALTLPTWQPPGAAFGIAWTVLYVLIALAAALVWGHVGAPRRWLALALWTLQMVLNWLWAPVFFLYHQLLPAAVLIGAILLVSILATVVFARISRTAAWLMVPYLLWLAFAAALDVSVWQLNPGA